MRFCPEYIILTSVLVCLMACTGHDDVPTAPAPREICLAGSTSPVVESRATEDLPTDYNLWVAAVYHSQDNSEHSYYFRSEKKFAWSATEMLWTGADEDLYYPISGSMDLLAYALLDDAHKPAATYSPTALSASDRTFSSMTLDFGTALDGSGPVLFSDIQSTSCGASVPTPVMQFHHTMAKVVFSARTDDQNTSDRFTIHQFTVKSVKTSGRLLVTARPYTVINGVASGSSYDWLSLYPARDVALVDDGEYTRPMLTSDPDTPGNMIGHPLYVPRQGTAAADVKVELTYSYYYSETSSMGPEKTVITLHAADWLPGYQYNYIINCRLSGITVECCVAGAIVDTNPTDIKLDEKYKGDNPI